MTVRIIADSSCNIPDTYRQNLDILQVPAWINFADGTSLRNGVDISDEEFYQRLQSEEHIPTTAQPTPQDFVEAVEACDEDEVLLATVSSRLSGTHASAVQAAALITDRQVYTFDTLSASMGAGWQIIAGAESAASGADIKTITTEMKRIQEQVETIFIIDTLKYLAASGRAPVLKAMLGSLLSIKPMLSFNDGLLELSGSVRGRKRSKRELVDRSVAWAGERPVRLAVIHANTPHEAEELSEVVRTRIDVRELAIVELGPVLGTLAGPGTLALGGYPLN